MTPALLLVLLVLFLAKRDEASPVVGAIDPMAAQRDAQLASWLTRGNNWFALRFRSGSWMKPMWIDRESVRSWHKFGDLFAYVPQFGGWMAVKPWM